MPIGPLPIPAFARTGRSVSPHPFRSSLLRSNGEGDHAAKTAWWRGLTVAATDKAYKNARSLRRELSLPEKLLRVRLRGADVRFRRQHPIGPYVLDFYCASAKLAVEVDGFAHDTGNRPQRDEVRTEWLTDQGIQVLRIPAKDVLTDPDSVAEAILRLCEHPSTGCAGRSPSPRAALAGRSGRLPSSSSLRRRRGEGDRPRSGW